MKATIRRTGGSVVDLEGTPDELERFLKDNKFYINVSPPLTTAPVCVPSIWTVPYTEVCVHDYPFPWNGIVPPNCTKCGKAPTYPNFTITTTCIDNGNKVS